MDEIFFLSATTTQSPYACRNMTILVGYDQPGSDITSNTLANYTLCCQWCLSTSNCVAYTWGLPTAGSDANVCFLKYAIPGSTPASYLPSAHY